MDILTAACVLNVGIVDGLLGVAGMMIVRQWIPKIPYVGGGSLWLTLEALDETQPALLTWQLVTPKLAQIAYPLVN